jgi:hypothetical protein
VLLAAAGCARSGESRGERRERKAAGQRSKGRRERRQQGAATWLRVRDIGPLVGRLGLG